MKAITPLLRTFLKNKSPHVAAECLTIVIPAFGIQQTTVNNITTTYHYAAPGGGARSAYAGQTINITNYNEDIVLDGNTFLANSAIVFTRGNVTNTNTFSTSTLDLSIQPTDNQTRLDIVGGKWKGAKVGLARVYIDQANKVVGGVNLFTGNLQDVVATRSGIELKVVSFLGSLGAAFPKNLYTNHCHHSFGDVGCKYVNTPIRFIQPTANIKTYFTGAHFSSYDSANSFCFFKYGGNAGMSVSAYTMASYYVNRPPISGMFWGVKNTVGTATTIDYYEIDAMANAPALGSNYFFLNISTLPQANIDDMITANTTDILLIPNCNKRLSNCTFLFHNSDNFSGFPAIPPSSIANGKAANSTTISQAD